MRSRRLKLVAAMLRDAAPRHEDDPELRRGLLDSLKDFERQQHQQRQAQPQPHPHPLPAGAPRPPPAPARPPAPAAAAAAAAERRRWRTPAAAGGSAAWGDLPAAAPEPPSAPPLPRDAPSAPPLPQGAGLPGSSSAGRRGDEPDPLECQIVRPAQAVPRLGLGG